MINYKEMIPVAIAFAIMKHAGQTDKAGKEYVYHPITVSKLVNDFFGGSYSDEDLDIMTILALLHDVVEDTDTTIQEIEDLFGKLIAHYISKLTRNKNVKYMDYIIELAKERFTRCVKIGDITHNMDLRRLPNKPTEVDFKRQEKYDIAKEYLLRKEGII